MERLEDSYLSPQEVARRAEVRLGADPIPETIKMLWNTRAKLSTDAKATFELEPWPVGQVCRLAASSHGHRWLKFAHSYEHTLITAHEPPTWFRSACNLLVSVTITSPSPGSNQW